MGRVAGRTKAVYLLTRNNDKLLAARDAFSRYGIDLRQLKLDYPEIQADTSLEIARYAALRAARELRLNVLREDHSFYIGSLGIPGPYMNFTERKLSVRNLLRMLEPLPSRGGYYELSAVYATPSGRTLESVYKIPIEFAKNPAGKPRTGWDSVVMLRGSNRTLAQDPPEQRLEVWNKNFLNIARRISDGGR